MIYPFSSGDAKLSKYVERTLHIKNVMYSRYVPTFSAWQWKKRA
jgi:hypothetical protein